MARDTVTSRTARLTCRRDGVGQTHRGAVAALSGVLAPGAVAWATS